jgi:hypothetical protein
VQVLAGKTEILDSLFPSNKPAESNFISVNSEETIYIAWGCQGLFTCIHSTNQQALSFYVFNKDTLDTVPWDSIRKYNNYLKHYIIKPSMVNDDEDYTITYP